MGLFKQSQFWLLNYKTKTANSFFLYFLHLFFNSRPININPPQSSTGSRPLRINLFMFTTLAQPLCNHVFVINILAQPLCIDLFVDNIDIIVDNIFVLLLRIEMIINLDPHPL